AAAPPAARRTSNAPDGKIAPWTEVSSTRPAFSIVSVASVKMTRVDRCGSETDLIQTSRRPVGSGTVRDTPSVSPAVRPSRYTGIAVQVDGTPSGAWWS